MADLKTTGLSLTALIALVLSGAIYSGTQNVYYCDSRDLAFQCNRLSSTGKTCYLSTTSKICSEGWRKLNLTPFAPKDMAIETIGNESNEVVRDGRDWLCTGTQDSNICYFGSRVTIYKNIR